MIIARRSGIDAAVEREGPDGKYLSLFITDSGLVNQFGCYFMMSDSVIIKRTFLLIMMGHLWLAAHDSEYLQYHTI